LQLLGFFLEKRLFTLVFGNIVFYRYLSQESKKINFASIKLL
jgi:hypothetical protein